MPTAYLSPSQLKELTDVSVNPGAPQDGYPLIWNNATAKWEAGSVPRVNGLRFPATQVGNSNPNTLDDYEEGTFNPTLVDVSQGSGVDYESTGYAYDWSTGGYTKIGGICTYSGFIGISQKPARDSGRWVFLSTPFIADPLMLIHVVPNSLSSYNGLWSIGTAEPTTNVAYAYLSKATSFSAGTSLITLADLQVGLRISFCFSYRAI